MNGPKRKIKQIETHSSDCTSAYNRNIEITSRGCYWHGASVLKKITPTSSIVCGPFMRRNSTKSPFLIWGNAWRDIKVSPSLILDLVAPRFLLMKQISKRKEKKLNPGEIKNSHQLIVSCKLRWKETARSVVRLCFWCQFSNKKLKTVSEEVDITYYHRKICLRSLKSYIQKGQMFISDRSNSLICFWFLFLNCKNNLKI